MTKLNQLIAVEKGVKASANKAIDDAYHLIQKPEPIAGISRTYEPLADDGEQLPPESTKVQVRVAGLLEQTTDHFARLFDVVATKDDANTRARADVVVDGAVVLAQVPVTTLLFLEKQLTDMRTLIMKLPVLDPSDEWHWDSAQDCWRSDVAKTARTRKVLRNHVKAEATKEHPAQVEVYTEDSTMGYWSRTKFSGAIEESRRQDLLTKVEQLQTAVKFAREEANVLDVHDVQIGGAVFEFLLN